MLCLIFAGFLVSAVAGQDLTSPPFYTSSAGIAEEETMCVKQNGEVAQAGELMYEDCEVRCYCGDYGGEVCLPRCRRPVPPRDCKRVQRIPDPSDECCSIFVCRDPKSEV